MKKLFSEVKTSRTMANLFIVLCGILFYVLCENLSVVANAVATVYRILSPVIWGGVIAYILNPLAVMFNDKLFKKMKHKKLAWILSVILAFLVLLAILTVLISMVIPQLISSVGTIGKNFGQYYASVKDFFMRLDESVTIIDLDVEKILGSWSDIISKITEWIGLSLSDVAYSAYNVGSKMVSTVLSLVISIYMLFDKVNLKNGFKKICSATLKDSTYASWRKVASDSNKIFSSYIGGNLLDSLIVGVINIIVMLILRLPYPLLITVIVAVTNLIPTFGPIIGAIPCLLILVIIKPIDALWFLILVVALQTVDANLIKPFILGNGSGVRPVWVLISIILGGRMFGIIGMLLALPVFAILSNLIDEKLDRMIKKKNEQTELMLDE